VQFLSEVPINKDICSVMEHDLIIITSDGKVLEKEQTRNRKLLKQIAQDICDEIDAEILRDLAASSGNKDI
jgi:hypothetical protein